MGDRIMTVVIERDGDMWTAQCDPFDICTQGRNLDELLTRLRGQVAVDIRVAGGLENVPRLVACQIGSRVDDP